MLCCSGPTIGEAVPPGNEHLNTDPSSKLILRESPSIDWEWNVNVGSTDFGKEADDAVIYRRPKIAEGTALLCLICLWRIFGSAWQVDQCGRVPRSTGKTSMNA